jgi:hypothetical protein
MAGQVGIAQAIEQLRHELGKAQDEGADQQLRFQVAEVEVELMVELRSEAGANGKATFGVVSLGADGKLSEANFHRLKLKLNVKDEALGGRTAEVTDDDERPYDD